MRHKSLPSLHFYTSRLGKLAVHWIFHTNCTIREVESECVYSHQGPRWNHVALQRNAFSAAIAKQSGSKSPSILHCTNLLHDISRLYFIMTLTRDQRNGTLFAISVYPRMSSNHIICTVAHVEAKTTGKSVMVSVLCTVSSMHLFYAPCPKKHSLLNIVCSTVHK